MAVQDLWYLKTRRGEDGKPLKSKLYGKHPRYRVSWTEPGRKSPATQGFDNLKEARLHEASVRVDKATGGFVGRKAGEIPFRVYANEWLALHDGRPKTKERLTSELRKHIIDYFGDRPLRSIGQDDIQAWKLHLLSTLANSSARTVFGAGSAVFTSAVGKRIPVSPFAGVDPPAVEDRVIEPLPVGLVHALIDAAPPRYRAMFVVGAHAGLRLGEVTGMEAHRIGVRHPDGPALQVAQQLSTVNGRKPYLAPLKTKASARLVVMSRTLEAELAAHLAAFPAREMAIDDTVKGRGRPTTRTARLAFTTVAGRPVRRTTFADIMQQVKAKAFKAYVEAATSPQERIQAEADVTQHADVTFHDLRHFFASLLIAKGATPKEVQEALGHSKISETMDTYAHLWPGSGGRLRSMVDDVLGRKPHLVVVAA